MDKYQCTLFGRTDREPVNSSGKCWCGCGLIAPLATRNRPDFGIKKGEYTRYLRGHNGTRYQGERCVMEGCTSKTRSHNLCWVHYGKLKDHGDPRFQRRLKRVRDKHGYILVRAAGHPNAQKSGYIYEHKLVMSDVLKRALAADEQVHHVNGIRDDNRRENLELWSTSHPPGQRIEEKLAWCQEFLARYEGEVNSGREG